MDHYKSYNKEFGYNLRPKAESPKGYKHTEKAKKNISKAKKGIKPTTETKLKIIETITNLWKDPFFRKIHECSEKTKKKMAESQKGKIKSEETKNKISESNKGKIVSNETRLKMSKSRRGCHGKKIKPHSEEHKLKLSKPKSAETKKKMKEAQKIRRLNEKVNKYKMTA